MAAHSLPKLAIFEAIAAHPPNSTAVVHCLSGRTFTYGDLLRDVAAARQWLAGRAATNGTAPDVALRGERVAFLAENGNDYVGISPL